MNNKQKYEKWLEMAEDDLSTAEFMFDAGRNTYVAFMCEQAIEKLVKGIFVLNLNKEAPYTHNINLILDKIQSISEIPKYNDYKTFINELVMYYTASRYDVYKEKISKNLDKENTERIMLKSKEVFLWLKSQVKF